MCLWLSRFSAWEFKLAGTWLWGYDYVDQAGGAGFFGPHDLATAGLSVAGMPKVNSMNAWVGARTINDTQYGMVTGSDASLQWSRMEFTPEIRINNAIRFRAVYQIGNADGTETSHVCQQHSARTAVILLRRSTDPMVDRSPDPLGILAAGKGTSTGVWGSKTKRVTILPSLSA